MTESELLTNILNRLDLIYTSQLFVIGLLIGCGVVYLFYRLISYFL